MLKLTLLCLAAVTALGKTSCVNNPTDLGCSMTTSAENSVRTSTDTIPPNKSTSVGPRPDNTPLLQPSINPFGLTWLRSGPIIQGIPAINTAFLAGFTQLVKPGHCPPLRTRCLPGYSRYPLTTEVFPAQLCVGDLDCPGYDKCCFDVCLNESVCKSFRSVFWR